MFNRFALKLAWNLLLAVLIMVCVVRLIDTRALAAAMDAHAMTR